MKFMDDLAKEHVISFFDKSLRMFGDRPEAVRWTAEGQLARYKALLDIADSIEGSNILDFGCGKGDFLRFLKDRDIQARYTGFDINENLIAVARDKHPEAAFRVFDIEKDNLTEDFDYSFLCGVFNLEVYGTDELITFTLKKLFGHCRIGLAFNALSAHAPKKDFELHYVSEEKISDFAAKELSPFVTMRHDSIPYDFTMFVYR
jgi:SAM-dependent methyltransferase